MTDAGKFENLDIFNLRIIKTTITSSIIILIITITIIILIYRQNIIYYYYNSILGTPDNLNGY